MTENKLMHHLELQGWAGTLVSFLHVRDLQNDIEGGHHRGLFDEEFYSDRLEWFSFRGPVDALEPRSLIVVAVPAPQFRVVFGWKGRSIPLILPPTYVGYRRTTDHVRERIAAFLRPEGFAVADTRLPLKLLAACCGLAEYGRNNILFRAGMGSFLQLCAYYSDLPCGSDSWQPPAMLKRCIACTACLKACPTGAITRSQFLLHANRCVPFHNERNRPLPEWLGPRWHDSVIGCMLCQRCCPENKDVKKNVVDKARFSEAETRLLLDGDKDRLPAATLSKWSDLGLSEDLAVIMRNLATILHSQT